MRRLSEPYRATSRIVSVFATVLLLTITANAYTVVMRGGRRLEIPSQFVVTTSTLTYETVPGIQITLQISAVDIAATEKANNEPPGSLLKRGQSLPAETANSAKSPEGQESSTPATPARRTITNRDLEPAMRRRRDSEVAYERKRKERGLPSIEELRGQAALESASIGAELEQRRAAERESEDYWRGRAMALRTEMAALDAELTYVRARLDEGPFAMSNGWANGTSSTVTSVIPFVSFGRFGGRSGGNLGPGRFPDPSAGWRAGQPGWCAVPRGPNVFVAPRAGAQISGRVRLGGVSTRGQVFLNPGTIRPQRPMVIGGYPVFPNIISFGSTSTNYDGSYERSALITRFNELGAARAGLGARWRALEEEARRVGAPPGWLRP